MKRYTFCLAALLFLAAAAERPTARATDPLPRLEVDGHFFRQNSGARWTGIQATDFNLFNRFIRRRGHHTDPAAAG